MLVLTRKEGEGLQIGEDVEIVVVKVGRGRVRIGIIAPNEKPVGRTRNRDGKPNSSRCTVKIPSPLGRLVKDRLQSK